MFYVKLINDRKLIIMYFIVFVLPKPAEKSISYDKYISLDKNLYFLIFEIYKI